MNLTLRSAEPVGRTLSVLLLSLLLVLLLAACAATPTPTPAPQPVPGPTGQALPPAAAINLDAQTQALIAAAPHTVFLIPFSHWDTDWHDTYQAYAALADRNILAAITLAKTSPRFRYAIEQVVFAQHFWETYPERRADLVALVQSGQISFAWGGITQPDSSLVAPAIQARNLESGREWVEQAFGVRPATAWQSDAFGNAASLPLFLNAFETPFLYMGRGPGICESQFRCNSPLPAAFYWSTPAAPESRVLVAYLFYSNAYWAVAQQTDAGAQLQTLRTVIERELGRGNARYLLLPMGADFADPWPDLPDLVERWNAANKDIALVMADPQTAFTYLDTLDLPRYAMDLNPIWQAFYGTRPAAKIADKESEYFLTAADKFGFFVGAPPSSAWYTATVNAHYDNIAGVSFDRVWETSQLPRYEAALATAAHDLAQTVAAIAGRVPADLVVFNPTSWPRSEVVELAGFGLDPAGLPGPVQRLGGDRIAVRVPDVPATGYLAPAAVTQTLAHPATLSQSGSAFTLGNDLVTVTLDGDHGGTMTSLTYGGGPELLKGYGDDLVYLTDNGDVYGAFFGPEVARASTVSATLSGLAEGPLLARVQSVFLLGGRPVTRTVTVAAESPLVEVALDVSALPQTSAIVQIPTVLQTGERTDDLGFGALTHAVDDSPIVSGTVTYRREVFYPIMYWADVSANGAGLSLLTHGLQGLGGTQTLNLLLVREVSDDGKEGVSDGGYHTLRYAYLPHAGPADPGQVARAAYAFNQPLIPAWRAAGRVTIEVPFTAVPISFPAGEITDLPLSQSLIAADSGLVADLTRRNSRVEALVLDYDPQSPVRLTTAGGRVVLPAATVATVPVDLPGR